MTIQHQARPCPCDPGLVRGPVQYRHCVSLLLEGVATADCLVVLSRQRSGSRIVFGMLPAGLLLVSMVRPSLGHSCKLVTQLGVLACRVHRAVCSQLVADLVDIISHVVGDLLGRKHFAIPSPQAIPRTSPMAKQARTCRANLKHLTAIIHRGANRHKCPIRLGTNQFPVWHTSITYRRPRHTSPRLGTWRHPQSRNRPTTRHRTHHTVFLPVNTEVTKVISKGRLGRDIHIEGDDVLPSSSGCRDDRLP